MNSRDIDQLAKKIWDYHLMRQPLKKADYIFVLCSNDLRVAEYAAKLYQDGWAPKIIFSGNRGSLTNTWPEPEAEKFAQIAIREGVPEKDIIKEPNATNTGENVAFTRKLFQDKDLAIGSLIALQKPFMERRAYATIKKLWPEIDFVVSSPPISYENYPNEILDKEYLINTMVGDLQRLQLYPLKGFIVPQPIPKDVWDAYEKLVQAGFTKHLVVQS
ncbi:MAG: hypothetical protein A3F33_02870 [Candidatus Woykebacteria bacterium RIFCSPHIGHO2_12_FULL_43_10]|uniref:DUF218 domain-containing protein n=2 Tax=Candidatus Woykeibacteriota TaxID=1817899 RepID=A0A1G1WXZ6_9BACT|nr:MAG: hypothetical protein A2802_01495 [Candidatus Woykebacteria bacterium RIFCSPHIGHO2_01_FULL_43_29]OGY28691.1 MAG: hypothetical protein A3J50_01075 [Candidatus Woykebacteria bacterium RIFCSPHIGHO2_02_FULL_43_16b]OGY29766.1 MAG: hypothetical protein A3F33_02870 [Candidatus Woykebacteria bacterium RIFCSPHIGHO2_12_FULL_43_10]OGY32441.1 MAG: hypothetical protein A3A61_00600 [Candidatus Woykebacteria bacterium RIFCSPLOWO2_01_FULL_43_14]